MATRKVSAVWSPEALADIEAIFYRVVIDVPEIIRIVDGRQDLDQIFADRDDL